MTQSFTMESAIRIHEADAAGVLFFGRYFTLAHNAHETFLAELGVEMAELIRRRDWVPAVVHAESDYRRPLRAGDRAVTTLVVTQVRRRMYRLWSEIRNGSGEVSCTIRTAHMAVNLATGASVPIPEVLRSQLEARCVPPGQDPS